MKKNRLLTATAICCALTGMTSHYARAQVSLHNVGNLTGQSTIAAGDIQTFGAPLPASVFDELKEKSATHKAQKAIRTHRAHKAASETSDSFPEPPASKKVLVQAPGIDPKEAETAPVNTQMQTTDGKPYYYDANHEFHPGTVPADSPVKANRDIFNHDDDFQAADENHSAGAISASQGSASGGDGSSNTDRIPVGSDGQPLAAYDDSKEDKQAELNEALKHMMPNSDDILAVRHHQRTVHEADEAPLQNYKPAIRSITLSLEPGHVPPMIHLAYGVTTSITFSDVTGAPWYINKALTDDSSYNAISTSGKDDEKTNVVTIYPKKEFTQGRNLTVFLEHSSLPAIFQLETGADPSVDYRLDTTIPQRGPNAREDFVESALPATDDAMMVKFVDGTPPKGSRRLKSDNPAVEAWRYQKMMYVRSEMPLMSPQPLKYSAGHISGIQVYGLRPTPDVVVSNHGELITVRLGE